MYEPRKKIKDSLSPHLPLSKYNFVYSYTEPDMPFGIQPVHLVLILFIALLIFGPTRLSNLGRRLSKSIEEHLKRPPQVLNGAMQDKTDGVCSFCGTSNPSSARFCSKCGISLSK